VRERVCGPWTLKKVILHVETSASSQFPLPSYWNTAEASASIYEVALPFGFDLQPEAATNELGFDLSHDVVATVSAGDDAPVAGVPVTFAVIAGPNAGPTGSAATNDAGEATFSYTPAVAPSSLGTDTIEACFTVPDGYAATVCDTVAKTWHDTTPPTATCIPSVNPGGNEPKAPGKGGKGQNPDGFYALAAADVVWPASTLEVYVVDTGSGTVFGPYPVGTAIKYTEARGAPPGAKKMGSDGDAVDIHITGNGDAELFAVDGSGNRSNPVACPVPPPPQ
jgi:hypothetical protein